MFQFEFMFVRNCSTQSQFRTVRIAKRMSILFKYQEKCREKFLGYSLSNSPSNLFACLLQFNVVLYWCGCICAVDNACELCCKAHATIDLYFALGERTRNQPLFVFGRKKKKWPKKYVSVCVYLWITVKRWDLCYFLHSVKIISYSWVHSEKFVYSFKL